MVFASLIFLFLFLPLNLLLYYLSGNQNYRNWLLVVFSFFFYSWGEPVWIVVMVFSASVDYINARVIERFRGTHWARVGLLSSLAVNLGLLAIFKYSGFFYENLNAAFGLSLRVPAFALPIGISFYTFQAISYVVDVYRNEVKARQSYLKFIMFISLYHQLVAGPIVRYAHIANEIENRTTKIADIANGINRFCIGLFKKVFFANVAGEVVAQYLGGDIQSLSVGGAWFGLLMFSLQIYFDFSGYSDMAIGLGWMFGFHYHENFNYPYIARSATDFWRRWHISLSTFFRDYIYIPLGGNQRNAFLNLFFVWFLTGLWHGASWNFILWGLYFGVFIGMERLFLRKILEAAPKFISHVYLLLVAIIGWAIFYFTDLSQLTSFFKVLFGFGTNPGWNFELSLDLKSHALWLLMAMICCMPVYHFAKKHLKEKVGPVAVESLRFAYIGLNVLFIFISVALLVGKSYNPFLYFRF